MTKLVLDACCGSRMFWFDKRNENALFMDNRVLNDVLCDGRSLEVRPDLVADFTDMPFEDNSFYLVVFDPPHIKCGENSWTAKKYGCLEDGWEELLRKGFSECFRVLKPYGTLIFKWNETDIPVKKIIKLAEQKPLFGHKSGKRSLTHWITFMKGANDES